MRKKILLSQLSEEQGKLWYTALTTQRIDVTWEPSTTDLLQLMEQRQRERAPIPDLIVLDIGIRSADSSTLLASSLCRWCSEHYPDLKIILTNPRQEQIRQAESRWATRQGAVDLFPRLQKDNISSTIKKVTDYLSCKFWQEPIDQLADTVQFTDDAAKDDGEQSPVAIAEPDPKGKKRNVRDAATEELARKIAMIPLMIMSGELEGGTQTTESGISLDATLSQLTLYDTEIDINAPSGEVAQALNESAQAPGVILTDDNHFVGMISRRLFLEYMSRPYGLELFQKRPTRVLYNQCKTDHLILQGTASVVLAAQTCLQRPSELIYEPIVVKMESGVYRILDVPDLLQAQMQIQDLATRMLREQTQARMIQTEKMASLGQIVAEVSHDIRNPVNFIYSNMDYLTTYTNGLMDMVRAYSQQPQEPAAAIAIKEEIDWEFLQTDLPKVLKSIRFGAEQLMRLVSSLQSFSHMEDQETATAVNVNDCVENGLMILSNRLKDVVVHKNFGDVPPIQGYGGQLVQVFMNIIGNAIDALNEMQTKPKTSDLELTEGDTTILTAALEQWRPTLDLRSDVVQQAGQSWVSVKIADNGPGIPPEIQTRIFDSFFTTKKSGEGTGLGLAICNQIIAQKHGGRLQLKSPYVPVGSSEPAQGTEFEILLPLTTP